MCTPYEDGYTYLKKDTNIQCWQGHNYFLQIAIGATFILWWAVIFPCVICWLITRQRGKLGKITNLKLFGIFYIGLTDDSFYWEIIVMNIRKLAIIMASTFISNKN